MPRETSCLFLTVGVDFNVIADTVKGIQVHGRQIMGVNPSRWVTSGVFERQASNISCVVTKQQFCVSLWEKKLPLWGIRLYICQFSLANYKRTDREIECRWKTEHKPISYRLRLQGPFTSRVSMKPKWLGTLPSVCAACKQMRNRERFSF